MTVKNLGQVQALWIGTTPPTNTTMLWYDTNDGVHIHKYYNTYTSTWVAFTIVGGTAPLAVSGGNVIINYNSAQFELIGGALSIKNSVLGNPPFDISDITGLATALAGKVDKITGYSLMSDAEIARLALITQYTHPTSIITPGVYKSFTVDAYGHITAIDDDNVVHITGTETVLGTKTFDADLTTFKRIYSDIATDPDLLLLTAIIGRSNSIGIEGEGTGVSGYGIVGKSPNIPVLAMSQVTTGTGSRTSLVLSGDPANTTVANDYGIALQWSLPKSGDVVDISAGVMTCLWTDVTADQEDSRFEWYVRDLGVLTKRMTLSNEGKLTIPKLNLSGGTSGKFLYIDGNKDIVFGEAPTTTYTLRLPSSSTVAGRCALAVEGTDYPTGWTIGAWISNPHDLLITHDLGQYVISVTVFSVVEIVDEFDVLHVTQRQMIANAAYSGVFAPDVNSLRIEGLATISTDLFVHVILSNRPNA